MTAKRDRAPVVTARATAEWRFGYRESEYNIAVAECFFRFSPCARGTIDADGVSRDTWGCVRDVSTYRARDYVAMRGCLRDADT